MGQIGSFENVTELFFVAETTGDAIPPMMLEGNLFETFLVIYLCGLKFSNLNVNFLGMACKILETIKLYAVGACAIRCKTRAYYSQ